MSRTLSPSSQKPYGVAPVVTIWSLARSSFYAARGRQQHPREAQKRGPKALSDLGILQGNDRGSQQSRICGSGLSDRQGADGYAFRHLYNREQRIDFDAPFELALQPLE